MKLGVFSIPPSSYFCPQLLFPLTNTEAGEFTTNQNNCPFNTLFYTIHF